jgi:hypothetical protein
MIGQRDMNHARFVVPARRVAIGGDDDPERAGVRLARTSERGWLTGCSARCHAGASFADRRAVDQRGGRAAAFGRAAVEIAFDIAAKRGASGNARSEAGG